MLQNAQVFLILDYGMPGIKIDFMSIEDLTVIIEKRQSNNLPATYLDLEQPPPYPISTTLRKRLTREISSLPEQQRKIIKLTLQGLSNTDIAIRLKISVNQVRVQRTYAKNRLRSRMRDA